MFPNGTDELADVHGLGSLDVRVAGREDVFEYSA